MILRDTELLHDDLKILVSKILADCKYHKLPFEVFETGRTMERQKHLHAEGRSKLLESKHIIVYDDDGSLLKKSKAVDFVLRYEHDKIKVWSWCQVGDMEQRKLDMAYYKMLSDLVEAKYPQLISGGKWKDFQDWPHYELKA